MVNNKGLFMLYFLIFFNIGIGILVAEFNYNLKFQMILGILFGVINLIIVWIFGFLKIEKKGNGKIELIIFGSKDIKKIDEVNY